MWEGREDYVLIHGWTAGSLENAVWWESFGTERVLCCQREDSGVTTQVDRCGMPVAARPHRVKDGLEIR